MGRVSGNSATATPFPEDAPDGVAGGSSGGGQAAGLSITDEALAERLRRGDVQAGEALVERHVDGLLRYLTRLCRNAQLAEELHQQTWLSVLENIERYRPAAGAGFKSWLYRIATNKANDQWRRRGRDNAVRHQLALVRDEAQRPVATPAEQDENAAALHRALEQLPEPQRQVVVLRYFADLKFNEIAEVVGCPLNTALGRMHKAMIKLRNALSSDRGTQ